MPYRKKKSNILMGSRILIWCVAVLLLMLGLVLVLQGSVNTAQLRTNIIQALKQKTGQEIYIRGGVTVRILPSPVVYLSGVELRNSDDKSPNPEVMVEVVALYISPLTLFADIPQVNEIDLGAPVLDISRGRDKQLHWGWLTGSLMNALIDPAGKDSPLSIGISAGQILYHDQSTDQTTAIKDIYASGNTGAHLGLNGQADALGNTIQFSVDTQSNDVASSPGAMPLNIMLFTDSKNTMKLKGSLDLLGNKLTGVYELEMDNARNWLKSAQKKDVQTIQSPLPLKFSGKWVQTGGEIEIREAQFQGLNSAATGSLGLQWNDWKPTIIIEADFKAFDYNQFADAFGETFSGTVAPRTQPGYNAEAKPVNPLPENIQVMTYLNIEQLFFGAQTWHNAKISAALADAAITVNQFNVVLPGETELSLFGVISEANTSGLRFEGNMEVQGKSLRDMLAVVDKSAVALPKASFDAFSANANVFVSSAQLRLSEASLKINDLRLDGGLVAYFDATPRVEADVKLQDINFDYFRNIWRETHKEPGDYFLKFNKNIDWSLLRKWRGSIDFKVAVNNFTFMERQGTMASFRLSARDGELGLYNMRFNYPKDTLDANISIDVKGEVPVISALLNTTELDTAYFMPLPAAAEVAKPEDATLKKRTWSEELIDFEWMEGYGATLDISIGKLRHKDLTFDAVKFRGKLENNALIFKNATFNYWDGKCTVSGQFYGGTVPGASLSYMLYNLRMKDLLRSISGHQNIDGRISISGTATASGVNPLSWLNQADANIVIAGRGVNVTGVNLAGVVDAVRVSRTASDVFTNANLALLRGSTEFSVDGTLNIKNALVRTPGIALKSGTANGVLNLEAKLVPWRLDSTLLFRFPILSTENVPTLTMQVSGPIEALQMRTDTSSLEAYVAKQITGH